MRQYKIELHSHHIDEDKLPQALEEFTKAFGAVNRFMIEKMNRDADKVSNHTSVKVEGFGTIYVSAVEVQDGPTD